MIEVEQLVTKAQSGDHHAYAELIRSIHSILYRVSKTILRSDEDCADAIQEAIWKAYQNLDQLQERKYFKSWIIKILIHQCYKLSKRQNNVISLQETKQEIPVQAPYDQIELQEMIDRLEEPYRLVISLYYREKYTMREIGEMLEVPEGTIKSRLHKARQILQRYFEAKEAYSL
ncbi:RNA polymerase sigma factor [Risungbinella massiliensis]|uniref:RNA polymerase sigma factor n=1 Tax=Risungbinella massiliensis TaxID=1329796 RepID=UPI00069CB309|nr:sigma-70 family RNA polymerase sigma factor [Risungbinella massiliensis]